MTKRIVFEESAVYYTRNSSGTYTVVVPGGGPGGTPATTVESETSWGKAPAVGDDTPYARQDHTHGSPAAPTYSSVGADVAGAATSAVAGHVSAVTHLSDAASDGKQYARKDGTWTEVVAGSGLTHAQVMSRAILGF
jgi:hypothetical protein